MRLALAIFASLALVAECRTAAEKEARLKAIRMRTSRQLKEIFDELGIDHAGLDKEALRKKAYKEDAVHRWEQLHPEKAKKSSKGGGGGSGGGDRGRMPDLGGMEPPEGMDAGKWQDLMAQMRGDFSGEKDPERRRILEKLSKRGMSFGGGSGMTTEQLRNMEKMMDGLNKGDFPGTDDGGASAASTGGFHASSTPAGGDEDIADEDKMEL